MNNSNRELLYTCIAGVLALCLMAATASIISSQKSLMQNLGIISETNRVLSSTNSSLAKAVIDFKSKGGSNAKEQLALANDQLGALVAQQREIDSLSRVQEELRNDLARYLAKRNDDDNTNINIISGE